MELCALHFRIHSHWLSGSVTVAFWQNVRAQPQRLELDKNSVAGVQACYIVFVNKMAETSGGVKGDVKHWRGILNESGRISDLIRKEK